MRNVIQVIMAIKEVASEIISHGPAQCHPSVATRTPPSIWATSKGDVTMWAWHSHATARDAAQGLGTTGGELVLGCSVVFGAWFGINPSCQGEAMTQRDHSSS